MPHYRHNAEHADRRGVLCLWRELAHRHIYTKTKRMTFVIRSALWSSGEGGILDQFCTILTPFYMYLILQIIRSTMGYRGKLSAFSPSQSSHTILSVSHRCNFFIAKMHQNPPHLYQFNLLKTNKIIIIYLKHPFSLERFFSISHY